MGLGIVHVGIDCELCRMYGATASTISRCLMLGLLGNGVNSPPTPELHLIMNYWRKVPGKSAYAHTYEGVSPSVKLTPGQGTMYDEQ
jgi:hypothetical protein